MQPRLASPRERFPGRSSHRLRNATAQLGSRQLEAMDSGRPRALAWPEAVAGELLGIGYFLAERDQFLRMAAISLRQPTEQKTSGRPISLTGTGSLHVGQ